MYRSGIKPLALATILGFSSLTIAQNTPPTAPTKSAKQQAFRQLLEKQREQQKSGGPQTIDNPTAMPAAEMPALPGKVMPPTKGTPTPGTNPREMTAEQRQALVERQREAFAKLPRPTESQLQSIVNTAKVVDQKRDRTSAGLPKVAPQTPSEVSRAVDETLAKELAPLLKAAATTDKTTPVNITTSKCDDATYLRRVYLDIIGRAPTPEELTAFSFDPAANKRAMKVDQLLAQKEYGRKLGPLLARCRHVPQSR
jgi:hypothetical protein